MITNHFGFVSVASARKKELLLTSVTSISQLLNANDLFYFGLKTVKKPFAKDKKSVYISKICEGVVFFSRVAQHGDMLDFILRAREANRIEST